MDGLGKFILQEMDTMYNYRYVSKEETSPVRERLEEIIHEVQNLVREDFTFKYKFIGSASRNMITCDPDSNIGFDFDVNIEVNDEDEEYSAGEIRNIIRNALDKVAWRYGYDYCEDSTRVLTIKVKDRQRSRILHSCDFAIVYNYGDGKQQYIRFNKVSQTYQWVEQGKGYYRVPEKIEWLKKNKLWSDVRERYIYKKNVNMNPNKHSRTIFAETINDICGKNGYND